MNRVASRLLVAHCCRNSSQHNKIAGFCLGDVCEPGLNVLYVAHHQDYLPVMSTSDYSKWLLTGSNKKISLPAEVDDVMVLGII